MHKVREEIIVAVQGGAMKIYVATVEALRKKKKDRVKQNEFPEFQTPPLKANVPFLHVFVESHPVYGQTRETDPVFS